MTFICIGYSAGQSYFCMISVTALHSGSAEPITECWFTVYKWAKINLFASVVKGGGEELNYKIFYLWFYLMYGFIIKIIYCFQVLELDVS